MTVVIVDAAAVPGTMSTNATTLDNRNFLKANLPLCRIASDATRSGRALETGKSLGSFGTGA
jgi:hypothetical protein